MTQRMIAFTVALAAAWLWLGALGSSTASAAAAGSTAPAGAAASLAAATASEWSWPLRGSPSVVQGFQPPPEPWLAGHRGVDLLASPGEPVLAAGAGRVSFAGWVGRVPAVTVTHPDGRRTTYQPVLANVVRGEEVSRGSILGRVSAGGSHCLPRACLHWGLRLGSRYLDPLSLVDAKVEVRLLPLWSWPAAPPRLGSVGQLPFITANPAHPANGELARLGALNRARASPWEPLQRPRADQSSAGRSAASLA